MNINLFLAAGSPLSVSSDFASKVSIAVISALLGFLGSYVLDRMKAGREPRKRLSWDAITLRGLVSVTPAIREKVRVMYEHNVVDDITSVDCRLSNTGNRAVKNTYVRFAFPERCTILDCQPDPVPEPELGVKEAPDPKGNRTRERRYLLGHLEVGQEVRLRIVAAGQTATEWKIHAHHDEGDLQFTQRDVARQTEDREHITPFVIWSVLLLALPETLNRLLSPIFPDLSLGSAIVGLTSVFLFVGLARHITPVARTIAVLVTKALSGPDDVHSKVEFGVGTRLDGGAVIETHTRQREQR